MGGVSNPAGQPAAHTQLPSTAVHLATSSHSVVPSNSASTLLQHLSQRPHLSISRRPEPPPIVPCPSDSQPTLYSQNVMNPSLQPPNNLYPEQYAHVSLSSNPPVQCLPSYSSVFSSRGSGQPVSFQPSVPPPPQPAPHPSYPQSIQQYQHAPHPFSQHLQSSIPPQMHASSNPLSQSALPPSYPQQMQTQLPSQPHQQLVLSNTSDCISSVTSMPPPAAGIPVAQYQHHQQQEQRQQLVDAQHQQHQYFPSVPANQQTSSMIAPQQVQPSNLSGHTVIKAQVVTGPPHAAKLVQLATPGKIQILHASAQHGLPGSQFTCISKGSLRALPAPPSSSAPILSNLLSNAPLNSSDSSGQTPTTVSASSAGSSMSTVTFQAPKTAPSSSSSSQPRAAPSSARNTKHTRPPKQINIPSVSLLEKAIQDSMYRGTDGSPVVKHPAAPKKSPSIDTRLINAKSISQQVSNIMPRLQEERESAPDKPETTVKLKISKNEGNYESKLIEVTKKSANQIALEKELLERKGPAPSSAAVLVVPKVLASNTITGNKPFILSGRLITGDEVDENESQEKQKDEVSEATNPDDPEPSVATEDDVSVMSEDHHDVGGAVEEAETVEDVDDAEITVIGESHPENKSDVEEVEEVPVRSFEMSKYDDLPEEEEPPPEESVVEIEDDESVHMTPARDIVIDLTSEAGDTPRGASQEEMPDKKPIVVDSELLMDIPPGTSMQMSLPLFPEPPSQVKSALPPRRGLSSKTTLCRSSLAPNLQRRKLPISVSKFATKPNTGDNAPGKSIDSPEKKETPVECTPSSVTEKDKAASETATTATTTATIKIDSVEQEVAVNDTSEDPTSEVVKSVATKESSVSQDTEKSLISQGDNVSASDISEPHQGRTACSETMRPDDSLHVKEETKVNKGKNKTEDEAGSQNPADSHANPQKMEQVTFDISVCDGSPAAKRRKEEAQSGGAQSGRSRCYSGEVGVDIVSQVESVEPQICSTGTDEEQVEKDKETEEEKEQGARKSRRNIRPQVAVPTASNKLGLSTKSEASGVTKLSKEASTPEDEEEPEAKKPKSARLSLRAKPNTPKGVSVKGKDHVTESTGSSETDSPSGGKATEAESDDSQKVPQTQSEGKPTRGPSTRRSKAMDEEDGAGCSTRSPSPQQVTVGTTPQSGKKKKNLTMKAREKTYKDFMQKQQEQDKKSGLVIKDSMQLVPVTPDVDLTGVPVIVEKNINCPFCAYKTHLARFMELHLKTHNYLRCDRCEYATKDKHDLEQHVEAVHSGATSHQCPHCEYRTMNLIYIKRHITLKHATMNKLTDS